MVKPAGDPVDDVSGWPPVDGGLIRNMLKKNFRSFHFGPSRDCLCNQTAIPTSLQNKDISGEVGAGSVRRPKPLNAVIFLRSRYLVNHSLRHLWRAHELLG